MEMTLERGLTLQRTLPRRVADWITTAGGLGWLSEIEMRDASFLVSFSQLLIYAPSLSPIAPFTFLCSFPSLLTLLLAWRPIKRYTG